MGGRTTSLLGSSFGEREQLLARCRDDSLALRGLDATTSSLSTGSTVNPNCVGHDLCR